LVKVCLESHVRFGFSGKKMAQDTSKIESKLKLHSALESCSVTFIPLAAFWESEINHNFKIFQGFLMK